MASTSDIRDIMNLGQTGPRPSAPKKKKAMDPQSRVTGVKREVQALMGDSIPPIAIVDQRSYKSRPSISQKLFKPRHWEDRPFQHGARTDGLVLRHWKRSVPGASIRPPTQANRASSADVEMGDDLKTPPAVQGSRFEEEFPSDKWNVKIAVPSYTNEQYETLLMSEDWTKPETDYLMDLCREYDLRWVVITDRYNPDEIQQIVGEGQPAESSNAEGDHGIKPTTRTMEAIKQRYYAIAAKLMEQQTPASTMTQAQFQDWEKMRDFDAKQESLRKTMVEKMFERSKDEAEEERSLLEELHRITKNEDDFIKMRRDLYARLEAVAPLRRTERGEEQSTAMYQTSAGMSMLLQTLVAKEKRMKRPGVPGNADGGAAPATPVDAHKWEKGKHPNQYTRRETMDSQPAESTSHKKTPASQPNIRVLSPQDELRFGISHPPERITSGVQFRHEKINRLTMAKSQSQTAKIQAALTELGIPPRLLMPTERVCRQFEGLIAEINVLLDARKVNEKIASEIRVLEEARRIRLGLPKEVKPAAAGVAEPMDGDVSEMADTSKIENTQDSSVLVADEDQGSKDNKPPSSSDNIQKKAEDAAAGGEENSSLRDASTKSDKISALSGNVSKLGEGTQDGKSESEEEEEENGSQVDREGDQSSNGDDDEEANNEVESEEDDDDDDGAVQVADDDDDEDDVEDVEEDDDEGGEEEGDEEEEDDEDDENQNDLEQEETEDVATLDSDAEQVHHEQDSSEAEEEVEENGEEKGGDGDEDEEEEEEEEDGGEDDRTAPVDHEAEVGSEDVDDAANGGTDDSDAEAPEANTKGSENGDGNDVNGAAKAKTEQGQVSEHLAPGTAASLGPRSHKRSASVISEASRAGSNRSGLGRKKRG